MKYLLIILSLFTIASCSLFKKKRQVDKDVIAQVKDETLYASDIQSLTKGLKGKDSLDVLKNYADSWVRKKLLLQKALENIPDDDYSITSKVEEYKEALILYEYEKALVSQRLDTMVKPAELNEWYEKLKADFPLEEDVYLLFFVKIKKDAPEMDKARKWIMKPKEEDDKHKLEGYAREFATSYQMEEGMWYQKGNVLKNFPLGEGDINALSNSGNFREFKTDDGTWFIKVADVMKAGQPSPLEFIRDQVERAVIEKRRLQLIEKTYDKIYSDGVQSKSVEVFIK